MRTWCRLPILLGLLALATGSLGNELEVQRLTWAGIKLVGGDTTVLIDAVGRDLWDGDAPGGLVSVTSDTRRTYALITHAHNDHFDPETLVRVLGERGYAIVAAPEAAYVASRGLRVIAAEPYMPVFRGGFAFTAVPAVDGLGAHQVNWIVTYQDIRLFHGGDTLWHGSFGNLGRQYGSLDVAFLPINGARVGRLATTESAAVMTPLQAVDAAELLRARVVVPMHFGNSDPPGYVEVDSPLKTFSTIAGRRGVSVRSLDPGEVLTLAADRPR